MKISTKILKIRIFLDLFYFYLIIIILIRYCMICVAPYLERESVVAPVALMLWLVYFLDFTLKKLMKLDHVFAPIAAWQYKFRSLFKKLSSGLCHKRLHSGWNFCMYHSQKNEQDINYFQVIPASFDSSFLCPSLWFSLSSSICLYLDQFYNKHIFHHWAHALAISTKDV